MQHLYKSERMELFRYLNHRPRPIYKVIIIKITIESVNIIRRVMQIRFEF